MNQQLSRDPSPRRYFWVLLTLLFLFCLRVLGQILVAFFGVKFLPPMEEWFSGFLPYPELLASQIIIILLFGKICLDFFRGHGYIVEPRPAMGINLLKFGFLYLGVMVIRYVIRMSLYPRERWAGGSIPIFFHWVLASFLIVLGRYHWRVSAEFKAARRNIKTRLVAWSQASLAGLGILLWIMFQVGPSLFAWQSGFRRSQYAVRVQHHATLTTADGTVLSSEIFHPQHVQRTPTVLVRIPLTKSIKNSLFVDFVGRLWAERGYTVVIQGTRGRYESGGQFYPLHGERQDGIETLNWIAQQPWYNGQIATWGGSAFGYTQWVISDQKNPGPSALAIYFASSDFYQMFHPAGAFSLYSALSWAGRSHGARDLDDFPAADRIFNAAQGSPLVDSDRRLAGEEIAFFREWAQHGQRDAFWTEVDGVKRAESVAAPALLMSGWYDPFLPTQLKDFQRIQNSSHAGVAAKSRIVIGPWTHAGEVIFPDGTRAQNFRRESLRVSLPWFDQNLRPPFVEAGDDYPVKLFVMSRNQWRMEKEWPLARARATSLFLESQGAANTASGNGTLNISEPADHEPADSFVYDPQHPVPTAGGAMIGAAAGIARQNAIESRNDVLVYSTAPLQEDMEITGPVTLVLFVSTSAVNTDFTAKLVDVHEDGWVYNVTDGILRRSYGSDGHTGDVHEIAIDLWPTSMVFSKGHRIRLEVSSSNFPRFDRNPNTGGDPLTETRAVTARQVVYHERRHPSRLIVPVIPVH